MHDTLHFVCTAHPVNLASVQAVELIVQLHVKFHARLKTLLPPCLCFSSNCQGDTDDSNAAWVLCVIKLNGNLVCPTRSNLAQALSEG